MSLKMLKRKKFSFIINFIFIYHVLFSQIISTLNVDKSDKIKSLNENLDPLEFSDSVPGFEHQEFHSQRIVPSNKVTASKITSSANLAATLLKKIGLPSQHTNFNSNKTILNSVLVKRMNQISTKAVLSSNSLITTTPISTTVSFDEEVLLKQINKLSNSPNNEKKNLKMTKKKKTKHMKLTTIKDLPLVTPRTFLGTSFNDTTLTLSSPSAPQATEHHSVMINHGGGAISTIRRTLSPTDSNSGYEHLQIGFQEPSNNFRNDQFPNFGLDINFTPPPIPNPQPIEPVEKPSPSPPQPISFPPKIKNEIRNLPINSNSQSVTNSKPIYSSRNGRLRGAHKKQISVNKRKSLALLKTNEQSNQIIPVSVGISNSFQNLKPAELPNFAELSFFGYRSDQDTPRSFHDKENYNNDNLNINHFRNQKNRKNNFEKISDFNNNNFNSIPPPITNPPTSNIQEPHNNSPSPRMNNHFNEFNFDLHPFFNPNAGPSQPHNNDLYQFFDSPFMPMNPPTMHNVHPHHHQQHHHTTTHHQTSHRYDENNPQLNHHHEQIKHHQTFSRQPIDNNEINSIHPINTPNGQYFQRRKLILSNGNTATAINEISSNNLGYGYPSYNVYKGDNEENMKWPKIFKFTDGRVNLNDFEKEKKLGKIEFGKGVAEDGNEYNFEHVRRDLFLILHGGSFNY